MGGNQSRANPAGGNTGGGRRRRDNHRSYYLVFGEPQLKYKGEGRGPLLFQVQVPKHDAANEVDCAETFRCPVGVSEVVVEEAGGSLQVTAKVTVQTACRVKLVAGGDVNIGADCGGVSISGSAQEFADRVIDAQEDAGDVDVTGVIARAALEDGAASPTRSEGNEDGRRAAEQRGVPSSNSLAVVCEFEARMPIETAATAASADSDERAVETEVRQCAAYILFRVGAPGSFNNPECCLLQRGDAVFKLDNVFDTGRDARGPPSDDDAAEGGEGVDGAPDDDDGEGVCVVCIENPKDTVILPCRHMCMCHECAQAVRSQRGKCPMCRCDIERLMRRAT